MHKLTIGIYVSIFLYAISQSIAYGIEAVTGTGEVASGCQQGHGYKVADFSVDNQNGIAPLTVKFSDQSPGSNTSFYWDFGDLSYSEAANPSHTYTAPGSYTVSLGVIDSCGGSATEIKTAYITVLDPHPPSADFSLRPTSGVVPFSAVVTDRSSGAITSWYWDFGDGYSSTSQHLDSHIYTTPGIYTVSLTVSGPLGSTTATKKNCVVAYAPMKADFSCGQAFDTAPVTISFIDRSIGNITVWEWDFGDGSHSAQQNPIHTYATPGIYAVGLSISGPTGVAHALRKNYLAIAHQGGDVNQDASVDLKDLVLVMQMLTEPKQHIPLGRIADVNGDHKTGLAEATYLLNFVALK
ncbi:MAG: PKD domain-containing protein [Thermodesulfobacteriota bacterium]